MRRPRDWSLIPAFALLTAAAVVFAVFIGGATAEASERRVRATRSFHAALASVDDATYRRDPTLRIHGVSHGAPSGVTVKVCAVESRTLAAHLATVLATGDTTLPFVLPIAATAASSARGEFELPDTPLGHYAVYAHANGRQPVRRDGVTVRDTVGGSVAVVLRSAQQIRVRLPDEASGARVLPLYAGHWPDSAWSDALGALPEFDLERRDPDGWPRALVLRHGDVTRWLRVDVGADGAAQIVPSSLDALAERRLTGPVAWSTSPFAALGATVTAHETSAALGNGTDGPGAAGGLTGPSGAGAG